MIRIRTIRFTTSSVQNRDGLDPDLIYTPRSVAVIDFKSERQ